MQAMRDHLTGKLPMYDVAYRIRTKSGDYKWYYDKGGISERDEFGKPLKVIGMVIDISKRKEMERQLTESSKNNPE
jgi:PAS domain S-box-containing protein